jgi:hypothetical protein
MVTAVSVRFGLFSHPLGGDRSDYFLGEHVMTAGKVPACGVHGKLVAPSSVLTNGFVVFCRVCLRSLASAPPLKQRPIRHRRGIQ